MEKWWREDSLGNAIKERGHKVASNFFMRCGMAVFRSTSDNIQLIFLSIHNTCNSFRKRHFQNVFRQRILVVIYRNDEFNGLFSWT